jgi:hypothetical protein
LRWSVCLGMRVRAVWIEALVRVGVGGVYARME